VAHAYTPGLRVAKFTRVRKDRRLPLLGEVSAKVGDEVKASDVIARTELPGNVATLNVGAKLSVDAEDLDRYMLKGEGDSVEKDEIVAESKSFFGLFKNSVRSPATGCIESISKLTGQVLMREPPIPVEIDAYVDGEIVEVHEGEGATVETWGAFIQGIFGIGGEVRGTIRILVDGPDRPLDPALIKEEHAGAILVGGSKIPHAAIQKAIAVGAAGVIGGGMDDQDLRSILGYELGVAITGTETIGVTIIVTEGFGEIAMAAGTFELLRANEGRFASINGATQIRAGVIRPEVVIPHLAEEHVEAEGGARAKEGLKPGHVVRIIRDPNFGKLGKVTALPPELEKMESETMVRVLEIEVEGERYLLPRANVELIEE
jgi:hypothetical protein